MSEQRQDRELLRSIGEIFSEGITYNIPEYQRGYKWTKKNISELFRDITIFSQSLTEKSLELPTLPCAILFKIFYKG